MRVLMRFSKGEEVKYISHLDTQRLFQRALRRAKLPCAYSQGFNPHTIISFACALPLNVCSNAEYCEIQLEGYVHPLDVKNRLNAVLPAGVRILNATEPKDDYPNVGSVIALAEYYFDTPCTDCAEKIKALLARDEILIEKKTKKGMAQVNVRGMILRLGYSGGQIHATLACSNTENLRADKMAEILEETGIKTSSATRNAVFVLHNGALTEPLEIK